MSIDLYCSIERIIVKFFKVVKPKLSCVIVLMAKDGNCDTRIENIEDERLL
jgi:hypothetical protein